MSESWHTEECTEKNGLPEENWLFISKFSLLTTSQTVDWRGASAPLFAPGRDVKNVKRLDSFRNSSRQRKLESVVFWQSECLKGFESLPPIFCPVFSRWENLSRFVKFDNFARLLVLVGHLWLGELCCVVLRCSKANYEVSILSSDFNCLRVPNNCVKSRISKFCEPCNFRPSSKGFKPKYPTPSFQSHTSKTQ